MIRRITLLEFTFKSENFFVIKISLLSITFILLVHHLLIFLKSTLTVPKIKDLVNSPNQKYQNIYDTISHKSKSYTNIDLLPMEINNPTISSGSIMNSEPNMKDELKMFLKKQLNNDIVSSNDQSSYYSNF